MSVMLTPSATRFVGPLSFAALSRHPVETDVLDLLPDGRIGHIVVADTADAIVVAPATAHWLGGDGERPGRRRRDRDVPRDVGAGRRRAGDGRRHVDAIRRRVANVARLRVVRLRDRRARIRARSPPARPGSAGWPSSAAIVDAVVAAVGDRPVRAPDPAARPPLAGPARDADLAGRHVVVTAGGTREAIDPVRFIGNRSTGRMGVAIAEAALDRGARVTLIAAERRGRRCRRTATVVRVESTADLRAALLRATHGPDGRRRLRRAGHGRRRRRLPAGGARRDEAPARGRPDAPSSSPTPDLLAEVARIAHGLDSDGGATREPLRPVPVLVGFAAETGSLERAADKLRAQGRRPARRQRRRRAGLGLRDRHEPRHDPRPPTARARTCRC